MEDTQSKEAETDSNNVAVPAMDKKRRSSKVKETKTVQKKQRIEQILLWFNQDMLPEDIKDMLALWINDKKEIEGLLLEATEEFNKPRPIEGRMYDLEVKIAVLFTDVNHLKNQVSTLSEMINELIKPVNEMSQMLKKLDQDNTRRR